MTATDSDTTRTPALAPARDLRLLSASEAIRSPSVAAVSVDVFDTLVWRRVPEPVDAFPLVAERLRAAGRLARGLEPDAFARLRRAAETAARNLRDDAEVTLAEIYALIPPWVFCHAIAPEEAAAVEHEVERELVVPDLDVVALLEGAEELGKRLVAVSDTYFSAGELRDLFAQPALGRVHFDAIFTSSDHRTNKSGGLFEIALRELGLDGEQVVHIGDNPEADIAIPGKLGIRCFAFERLPEPYRSVAQAERRFMPDASESPREAALVSALTATRTKVLSRVERAELPANLGPYWSYGASVLGPVFTGFAEWIHEHARSTGARKVLCLMREGALLADLVDRADAYLESGVEAVPFWINRSLCIRASIGEVSRAELGLLLSRRTPATVEELLRWLGLGIGELPEYASHARTTLDDPVVRSNLFDHLAATPRLRATILGNARALRERIVRYTQAMVGDDDAPVLLADLGWGATIQGHFARVLRQSGIEKPIVGLYLLTNARAAHQALSGVEPRGFLAEFGFPERSMDAVMRSPEILEQICMPPVGTQRDLGDDLEPVLEPVGVPPLQQVEADAARRGMLAYQREWARYRAAAPHKMGSLASAQRLLRPILLRSVVSPTAEEVATLGAWHHDEGQGSELTETIADERDVARLRYMTPDQARALPMTELYWPFGLAARVDEHWPSLMAAAAAGDIAWESMAAPLDTGAFTVRPSQGVDISESMTRRHEPKRNRLGLSMVTGTLLAPHIAALTFRPSERPAVLRIDWVRLRCSTQGRELPIEVRLEGSELGRLEVANCFHLDPDVFIAHGGSPELTFSLGEVTPGIVYRIDYEVAFAAMAISPVLPAGGRFTNLDHAALHVAEMEGEVARMAARMENSVTWRYTAPLRKLRGKLR